MVVAGEFSNVITACGYGVNCLSGVVDCECVKIDSVNVSEVSKLCSRSTLSLRALTWLSAL